MTSRSMNNHENHDLPLKVTEIEDGVFQIEWDENHPVTSVFNNWTEQDFLRLIDERCKEVLGDEYFKIKDKYQEQE